MKMLVTHGECRASLSYDDWEKVAVSCACSNSVGSTAVALLVQVAEGLRQPLEER